MIGNWSKRLGWVVFAGTLGVSALAAAAATPARIAQVNNASRAQLSGGVSPRLAAAVQLGPAPADQLLSSMALRFSMSATQQAALTQLLGELQAPASPHYHQWLTPEQFGAQFGMASSDIAQVKAWLASQGLTVTETGRGGQFVRFSGTVAQVEHAFGTQMVRVSLNGEEHLANTVAPSLPSSIAAVTTTITGLNDFSLRSHHIKTIVAPAPANASGLQPEFTSSGGNHYLAPGDIYSIYNESGLLSSSTNGTGVAIAVVGQSDISLANVAAFRTASGLSANVPTVSVYGPDPGVPSSLDEEESELDVEWVGATAPSAAILFITGKDVLDVALTEAIDNNVAPVVSMSYGDCEADFGAGELAYYDQLLQQGAAQGMTMVSAAGDDGASDCDFQKSVATHGYAVDFPSSSPYMTAVGGTTFNEGSGSYWSSSNNGNAGSATGYIPEVVWNDSVAAGTLAASGGGTSVYFAKPSWQVGAGVPSDASRDVPDVAMPASMLHDPYLFCITGFCANGFYSTANGLATVGGSSVSAPVFAGFMGLVVQKQGRQGVANNKLYALASSTYATNVFHDIVAGNNDSPCTAGTTDCSAGVAFGYTAGAGYDRASGLGSVNAGNLVNDWPLVTAAATTPAGITPTYVNVAGSDSSVTAGISVTMTVAVASAVTGVTATPTGSVQFTVDGVAVGAPVALSGGSATYALATTSLAVGAHTIAASYLGDGTYLGSKGAFTLTILSATAPNFTLSPSTATVTVPSGSAASGILFTVMPTNGFTGSVSFTASSSVSNLNVEPAFSVNPLTISSGANGTTTLTLLAFKPLAKGTLKTAGAANVHGSVLAAAGLCMFTVCVLLFPRRRKLGMLFAVLLVAGVCSVSGCASSSNANSNGTPQINATPGTYTITIFATSSANGASLTHSSTVTLVVQ